MFSCTARELHTVRTTGASKSGVSFEVRTRGWSFEIRCADGLAGELILLCLLRLALIARRVGTIRAIRLVLAGRRTHRVLLSPNRIFEAEFLSLVVSLTTPAFVSQPFQDVS